MSRDKGQVTEKEQAGTCSTACDAREGCDLLQKRRANSNISQEGRKYKLRTIQLVYLPPNTTSVLQPCDQGIDQSLKVNYRRRVLKKVIAKVDAGGDPKSHINISILDAMITTSAAWNDVTQDTIANCFRHAGFVTAAQSDNEEESPTSSSLDSNRTEVEQLLEHLKSQSIQGMPSAHDLFETDSYLPISAPLTEEEIISYIQEKEKKTPLSVPQPKEEDDSSAIVPITRKQCLEALNTVQSYLLQQAGSYNHLRERLGMKSFVEDAAINSQPQKTIIDYLKKE
ncbi:tigger transposable element-derived protein [Plakobranchus ocellatus]|uniref:Tigger transposable element-derived protein n=1 Tax=Plakobranchus ocellatus TaxID=259542 RepID=A0AAV4C7H3_9GAST|nr:tigger transposable element-derived protein [Plakobranchus ocellatus]